MRAGWEQKRLGEVCSLINRGVAPKYIESGGIAVLNQKCVRDHEVSFELGRRHDVAVKKVDEERYVRVGDVLVNSTGTGTLGRVAQVRTEPPEPTTVDTHVTIVRPEAGRFYPEFFGYMLIQIEDEIARSGEGASGQTELARSTLQNKFAVSFPISLPEQQRIVAILDEAFGGLATATANAEKNLKNARELFESYLRFRLIAGDATWAKRKLPEVAREFGRGKSKHRPRNDPKLYGGPYPFVQTGDISSADHWLTDYTQTYSELGLAQSRLWPKGTVCIAIVGATVGETAILNFEACFPDSVIGIVVDDATAESEYVEYLLQAFKALLKEKGKGTARDNLNLGTFEDQLFPFPTLEDQRFIVARLNELTAYKGELEEFYRKRLATISELRQSILQKAFSGELTSRPSQAIKEAAE